MKFPASILFLLFFGVSLNAQIQNHSVHSDDLVIIGKEIPTASLLLVNKDEPISGPYLNSIATFGREYQGSSALFVIFGYPDSDLVHPHLRKSAMLYTTSDATDMVLCASRANGSVRFITDNWENPLSERMRIHEDGVGIGTTSPKEQLHIKNGDIFMEDINGGVIMKSPNGNCWRMTVSDTGEAVFTAVTCPDI